ncbi:MAG: acetyl-CoA carboxylase biotin carboxylase subunit [Planctomycetes bacterium]|nr:acetyl-CoA carboxylase biotin carboxylase subunit [Planctomycetota bacterium]
MPRTIRKLLIANRGEIAVRILRACAELGIRSVAVYSDADEWSPHVAMADEAHRIGPAPAKESYLKIATLLEVARRAGCDALHPGYGFLSENPALARACAKAGVKFVGPSPEAIQKIGNKIEARKVARRAAVPVVPGVYDDIGETPDAHALEREIGFPMLIKAAAGGGGKGMRVVRAAAELPKAVREARSEAQSYFGDPAIFAERYLAGARHVEIQLLADEVGNAIHLGERECSVQRRHQKLVEEAPSPFLDEALRAEMGKAAVALARTVGYATAGTCEFLVDRNRDFYFLEMNTRLQVEHPVTEMVTGIDLVKAQLAVAAGRPLPIRQEDVAFRGWAMECRIYSEDPNDDFMPSAGRIEGLELPAGPGIRVDTGIAAGSEVTLFYDPLLAKLIAWGADRAEAIARMQRALREFRVVGLQTTIPFHLALLANPRFAAGEIHTGFLALETSIAATRGDRPEVAMLLAAALEYERIRRCTPQRVGPPEGRSAWRWGGAGWRNA